MTWQQGKKGKNKTDKTICQRKTGTTDSNEGQQTNKQKDVVVILKSNIVQSWQCTKTYPIGKIKTPINTKTKHEKQKLH